MSHGAETSGHKSTNAELPAVIQEPLNTVEGGSEMVEKAAGPKMAMDLAMGLVDAFTGGIVTKGGGGGGGGGHGH